MEISLLYLLFLSGVMAQVSQSPLLKTPQPQKNLQALSKAPKPVPQAPQLLSPQVPVAADNSPVPMRAWVKTDKKSVTIAEPVVYHLVIEYPEEMKLTQPDFMNIFKLFDIKKQGIDGPKTVGGFFSKKRLRTEYRIAVSAYDVGDIPVLPYSVELVNTKTGEIKSLPIADLKITVKGVKRRKTDGNDIRDLKPQMNLPPNKWLYLLIFAVLVILLDYIWYKYYYDKNREQLFTVVEEIKPLPDEIAMKKLQELQNKGFIKEGKIKEYYIELSEIVRSYLSARFNIHVIERTTEEVYSDLRKLNIEVPDGVIIPKDWKKIVVIIKGFLDNCDLVKFAKFVPKQENIDNDYESAVKIVNMTI